MFSFISNKLEFDTVKNDLHISLVDKQSAKYAQLIETGSKIPLVILVNIIIGSLVVAIMWNHAPALFLTSWVALLTLSILLRALLFFRYKNAQIETMSRWKNYFLLTSFFSGIVWGVVGILMAMYLPDKEQGFEAFVLGGMAAGSVTTSNAIRWNYLAFIYPMLLSLVIYFFLQNELLDYYMGIMILLFIFILSITSARFRNGEYEKLIVLKKLSDSQARIEDITSSMGEGVFVIDAKGSLEFINPEAEKLLGWTYEEISEMQDDNIQKLIHVQSENRDEECFIKKAYDNKEKCYSESEIFRRKNGELFPVSICMSPIYKEKDLYSGAVFIFEDITKRKNMEEELTRLALHDRLTGLYNRGSFDEKLSDELNRSNRYDRALSLLMFDIDFFKKVNDNYGHQAGDEALKNVAAIIEKSIRASDYPARFGGEEFMAILPETDSKSAVELAERIRKIIENENIHISETETIHITISVGVATSKKEMSDEELVKNVDEALYKAKNSGRNQVSI